MQELKKEKERRLFNKIEDWFPDEGHLRRDLYPKHIDFLRATKEHREVAFIAGNRTGKSEAMCYAISTWATGNYPHWWEGKVFKKPVNILVAGETGKLVRDSIQKKLFGDPTRIGSGMVPRDLIQDIRPKAGIPDAIDTVLVKHKLGGCSTIQTGSYDQGREAFQATEREVVALDEEPPMDIYVECLLRTLTTKGVVIAAFTPLKGLSEVVLSFMPGGKPS